MTKLNLRKIQPLSCSACVMALLFTTGLLSTKPVFGAIMNFNFLETSTGVVLTGDGSFNLDGLVGPITTPQRGGFLSGSGDLGVGPSGTVDVYSLDSDALSIPESLDVRLPGVGGARNTFGLADEDAGDAFGLMSGVVGDATDLMIYLPQGYVSGEPLSGSVTFPNSTLADLRLTPGQGSIAWAGHDGSFGANSVRYSVTPLPEPGSFVALAPALIGLIFLRKRQS